MKENSTRERILRGELFTLEAQYYILSFPAIPLLCTKRDKKKFSRALQKVIAAYITETTEVYETSTDEGAGHSVYWASLTTQ